jgi:NADH-quinone oxidoreductase subunit D
LEGETIKSADSHIGLLHRGTEKIMENKTYIQSIPYLNRLDYISPLAQEESFALAVERLLECEVPRRAQYIRVMMLELTRILNHLLVIATQGMDVGAMTPLL